MFPDHVQRILGLLHEVRATANGADARCPAHEDARSSLSVGVGKNSRALLRCHAGCTVHAVLNRIGLRFKDLWPAGYSHGTNGNGKPAGKIVATYNYRDESGTLLYQVCRLEPKSFRQRRPDGDGWAWTLGDTRRVLYRLPELLASTGTVYITEGEKDADALRDALHGAAADAVTCNPGGASELKPGSPGKFLPEYARHFAGRHVVVVADRDAAGRSHANAIRRTLAGVAASVRVVESPVGKDVSDFLSGGGNANDIAAWPDVPDAPAAPAPVSPVDDNGLVRLGQRDPASGRLVLSPSRTLPTATAYVEEFHTHPDARTLANCGGALFVWRNNRYEPIEQAAIESKLYPWLHGALRYVVNRQTGESELADFHANPSTVSHALRSIIAHVYVPGEIDPPAWVTPSPNDFPANELLPCRSMSIHLPTMRTIPPTPRLFVTASLDFDYDADPPEPVQWVKFLNEVFDGDKDSICLLQQWFGYCLIADTRQHKMMLMIGQRRSGKGTVARILKQLVGAGNVAGPTISSLAAPAAEGLWPLIGKSVAIVGDARFAGDGLSTVVERLLCISGEDTVTINRKYLPSVTMKLPTRFVFMTNDTPKISDASGALAGRFVVLKFRNSWFGREDLGLDRRLISELPGILHWAIEGWHSLRAMGRFHQPPASMELIEEIEDSLSPVGAFIRDRCAVGADERVYKSTLYDAWRAWCKEQGRDHAGTLPSFGRDLRSAVARLGTHQDREGRFYSGVGLKSVMVGDASLPTGTK